MTEANWTARTVTATVVAFYAIFLTVLAAATLDALFGWQLADSLRDVLSPVTGFFDDGVPNDPGDCDPQTQVCTQ